MYNEIHTARSVSLDTDEDGLSLYVLNDDESNDNYFIFKIPQDLHKELYELAESIRMALADERYWTMDWQK